MAEAAIIARVVATALDVDATAWNALLATQSHPTPFMRHEYLAALEESDSASPRTGWAPRFMTLWDGQGEDEVLIAACPLYLKNHSYGEYTFLCSMMFFIRLRSGPERTLHRYGQCAETHSKIRSGVDDRFAKVRP